MADLRLESRAFMPVKILCVAHGRCGLRLSAIKIGFIKMFQINIKTDDYMFLEK